MDIVIVNMRYRKNVKKYLLEKTRGKVAFYDYRVFNDSLSLMENIVFGTVNPLRKKANEDINKNQLITALTHCGKKIGIGDYRPYYGRFDVEVLKS